MSDAIRVGISGLGSGASMMIRAGSDDPRIRFIGAFDPVSPQIDAFVESFSAKRFRTFEAMCLDDAVDVVYIASPHQYHFDQAITALRHHKHVVVEKPLSLTLEQCTSIIDCERDSRGKIIVGHTHAFDPCMQAVQKIARTGELGALAMQLSFNFTDFLYRPRRPEELATEKGGGIAFNQLSHQIDMVRSVAQAPAVSVRANVGKLDSKRPTEGNAQVIITFGDGSSASIIYSAYDYFDSDELHGWVAESGQLKSADGHGGARRALRMSGLDETARREAYGYGKRTFPDKSAGSPHFGFFLATFEQGDVRIVKDGLDVFSAEGRRHVSVASDEVMSGHRNVLNALWLMVRDGVDCAQDAKWGRATLEIILAILASSNARAEVALRLQQ